MRKYSVKKELNEIAFLNKIVRFIKTKILKLLQKLKFGKKIKIPLGDYIVNEQKVDLKSRLGYLSEYSTALELSKIIQKSQGRLSSRSEPEKLQKIYDSKKSKLVQLKANSSEIQRQETAGQVIAEQIFNDVIIESEDFGLLTFDIELTGDSGKGVTKADLVLNVTKDSEKVIVDRITASLKAYKKSTINLSNSTFLSLIKTLFYDDVSSLPKRIPDFIEHFVDKFGSSDELKKLYDFQSIIGTEMKSGKTKEQARSLAKETHGEVIEIISKIFNTHYSKNKEVFNKRMLHMIGFDNKDDFYAAIGPAGNQKVLSSRRSKELQNLIENLTKGFELSISRNGKTKNASILFKDSKGVVILQATMTFADTGGKNAMGKTNTFIDMKRFL